MPKYPASHVIPKILWPYFLYGRGSATALRVQLVQGVLGASFIKVGGMFLALACSVTLAQLLGAEGYGIYGFAMACVGLLAIPVQLGFPNFVVRQCAIYLGRDDVSSIKGLLQRAFQVVLLLALAIGAVAAVVVGRWVPNSGAIAPQVMICAFLLLPLTAINSIQAAALRGLGKVALGQFPELFLRPLLFLACIFLTAAAFGSLPPTAAILANVVAMLLAFAVGSWLLYVSLPTGIGKATARFSDRESLLGTSPFFILGAVHVLTQQTDVLMLGVFTDAADVGAYRVVSQIALQVNFGLTIVNPVIAPHLARLHDGGDQPRLQRMVTLASIGAMAIAAPFAISFGLGGEWLLGTVFGAEFAFGYRTLAILAAGQLINASMGTCGLILNMTGHGWYSAAAAMIAGILNLALNLLLIPMFGIEGEAMATVASLIISNVLLLFWVYRFTGLIGTIFKFKLR